VKCDALNLYNFQGRSEFSMLRNFENKNKCLVVWLLVLNQDGRDKRIDQDHGMNQDGRDKRIDQDHGMNQDGRDKRIDQDYFAYFQF